MLSTVRRLSAAALAALLVWLAVLAALLGLFGASLDFAALAASLFAACAALMGLSGQREI